MSRSHRDGNIVLVSVAVFVLFAVSGLWTDPPAPAGPDMGLDGVAAVSISDTAVTVDPVVRP